LEKPAVAGGGAYFLPEEPGEQIRIRREGALRT